MRRVAFAAVCAALGFVVLPSFAQAAVLVQVGARVGKGASIGKLGSTGRSTGPHVHYEIWYDDVVRNPSKFIEAGHHVL